MAVDLTVGTVALASLATALFDEERPDRVIAALDRARRAQLDKRWFERSSRTSTR